MFAATVSSLRKTRAQTSSPPASAETEVLQAVLQELQLLREERRQFGEEIETQRRNQKALQCMEQRFEQISCSNNYPFFDVSADNGAGAGAIADVRESVGIRLKPDVYDGTAPLNEFLTQFALIAAHLRANGWDEAAKAITLAS